MAIVSFRTCGRAGPAPGQDRTQPSLSALWNTLSIWIARKKERRILRELAEDNGHLLIDLGVTRQQALDEARKPFWCSAGTSSG